MSTRSNIAIEDPKTKKVKVIYVHSDGYPYGVGKCLVDHYNKYDLAKELKPDNSQEAPELIQYQQLLKDGHEHLLAIQECWNEFGIEDFHRCKRMLLCLLLLYLLQT